jgi:hypothetical protein
MPERVIETRAPLVVLVAHGHRPKHMLHVPQITRLSQMQTSVVPDDSMFMCSGSAVYKHCLNCCVNCPSRFRG